MRFPRVILLGLLGCLPPLATHAQTTVTNTTYASGQTALVSGPTTIDAQTNVVVASGANVTYQASARIRLGPGFAASAGSAFHAVIGASAPPAVELTAPTEVALGQSVNFVVTARCAAGLSEIGLESCNPAGTPSANLGYFYVSATSVTHTFTWSSSTPGTYTFDAYAWNADRSLPVSRTKFITVIVRPAVVGDSDGDGIADAVEKTYGLDPANGFDGGQDADGDGVSNAEELRLGRDPLVYDRASNALVGTLPGSLSVDNKGSANYSIPLALPPGRGGMAPSLSINYNSGGGNGPLGIGFSLSTGFPQSITRGRSILARDGVTRGVKFDANDKFYLDGKRLICTSEQTIPYGTPGSTYRTEVDSFVTVTASGTGSNITAFTVTDKSGVAMTFGKSGTTTDGYQVGILNGADDTLAYTYALKRVQDTLGNSVDFTYASDPLKGEYVLTQIDYTANGASITAQNRVVLTYSASRTDKTFSYIFGRKFAREKRLDSIVAQSFVSSAWLDTASYTLNYGLSPDSSRSRIDNVAGKLWDATATATAGAWRALPATTFAWSTYSQATLPTYSDLPTLATEGDKVFAFGDFDGDGKEDYLDARPGQGLRVYRSTGSTVRGSQFVAESWLSVVATPAINPGGIIVADLNGDGKKDVLICRNDPGGSGLTITPCISTGSSFQVGSTMNLSPAAGRYWFDTSPGSLTSVNDFSYLRRLVGAGILVRFTPGDFYGDGREEILAHGYDGFRYLLKWNASTNALETGSPMNPGAPGTTPQISSWSTGWVASLAYPLTFFTSVRWSMDMSPMPCDFNGDGITDYFWQEKNSNLFPGSGNRSHNVNKGWRGSLSDGQGGGFPGAPPFFYDRGGGGSNTGNPIPSITDSVENNIRILLTGDFNGDGLTDFLRRSADGWSIYASKGALDSADANRPAMVFAGEFPATFTAPNGEILFTVSRFMPKAIWDRDFQNGLVEPEGSLPAQLSRVQADSGANTFVMDVNHDGLADLVWFVEYKKLNHPTDATDGLAAAINKGWWVAYSTGAGFAAPQKLTGGIWDKLATIVGGYVTGNSWTTAALQAPDLNGDGLPDWVANDNSGNPAFYAYSTGTFGDLIINVTNGLGRKTDIAYKAAKDDSIYTPGAAVTYPIRDLRSSTPVVSDVWHDAGTGVAADRAQFSYQYSGNRLDLSGRGALGFHSFVTLDTQTGLFKYQFLAQSFPMTGLTHREETYRQVTANKFNIISSHDNTVVFDQVSTYGTLWPFISQAVESRWEDNIGQLITAGSSVSSDPENLFKATKPAGAHITITAQSTFDGQSAPQLTLPGITGYNPGDTTYIASTSTWKNAAVGTSTFATFSELPGKITYGNLKKLSTDFGGGFTEKVETTYLIPVGALTGLVGTVKTTVDSPSGGTEVAPVKSYTYFGSTPLVATETVNAAAPDANLSTTTTYARDDLGRVTSTSIAGTDLQSAGQGPVSSYVVSKATAFDAHFDLPTATQNNYGHATTTVYHSFFGLPTSVTGANLDQYTTQYDALGRAIQTVDVNKGLKSTTTFDWETPTTAQTVPPPVGLTSGLTLTSAYKVVTNTTAQPTVIAYYDRLGRVIRTIKHGYIKYGITGDQLIVSDTIYNKLGQVVATSLPYLSGGDAFWTTTAYDKLGRVTQVTAPNGTVTTNTYNGRATSVSVDAPNLGGVDPVAQVNTTVVDPKGRTVAVYNADNVPAFSNTLGATASTPSIAFTLDGFGRMRTTTLLGQTQTITATYDALGRQLTLSDPDKGNWKYVNSALGQVLTQTDAKLNVTSSTFDRLGRPLSRTTTGDGSTETADFHYYDTADDTARHLIAKGTQGWIGAPQREVATTTGAPGFAAPATLNLHFYDAKGRPSIELALTDGQWFYTSSGYDDYSRLSEVRHYWRPPGHEADDDQSTLWQDFGYTYTYDGSSYLLSMKDSLDPSRTWWDQPTYDHLDRVTSVRKGASQTTTRTYSAQDGVLTAIKTGPTAGSTEIQNLSFGFDGLGNLTSRTSATASESFAYDNLNRLTTGGISGNPSYHANGNIDVKGSVSGAATAAYTYDSTHPHAVATAFGYSMSYDANGNLSTRTRAASVVAGVADPGETWAIQWAGFDKPRWMAKTKAGATVGSEFHYNAARSRVMQLEFDAMSGGAPSHYARKRLYGLGSTLEVNYDNTAGTGATPVWDLKTVRIYVPGPDGIIGAREFKSNVTSGSAEKTFLYHYDHLGSIESITPLLPAGSGTANDVGGKPGRFSEDAWGERRNPFTWTGVPLTTGPNASDDGGSDSLTPRGFTGHEMLDDLGLVHMNGRIYDPLLGRFLSADLVVQAPGSLQSYNRYSYVMNNPLTLTDPTGFYSILGLEFTDGGGVSGFMQDLASYQMAAASGAATGAGQYGVGLVQGSAAAVVGTANAIAHPIDAVQGATNGLGTLAGRAVFDTAALGGDIKNAAVATVSDPNKIGQAVGNFVTGTAIGVGAAKGLSAAGEMAGLAAKTERVAATGTAEARVAAAAPETGVVAEVKTATAPAAEAKNAASSLPEMKGMGATERGQALADGGFKQTKVSNSAAKNETWAHADGSEARVHPYGNEKATPHKSGNNAHMHKQDPAGNQLNDRGSVSTNPNETHIGQPNPKDFEEIRKRKNGT